MENFAELREIRFFENLDDKELKYLSSISRKRHFKKGEILFYEKETPKFLTLLCSGVLKVYKTDVKNNEIVIHRFMPKSLVAEVAILEGMDYPASAMFDSDGSVVEIDFIKFKTNILTNPDVAFNFFQSLSQKIQNLENVISLNIVLDSTSRVAKCICQDEDALVMKNNQLAQHLHMTPETLSRIFKKFTKLGFLEKKSGEYKIIDREGLTILYE
jgi:CRP/FNR family transcriptional regulator